VTLHRVLQVPSAKPALQDPLALADRKVHKGSKGRSVRRGVRVNAVKLVLPVRKGRSGRRDRKGKRAGRDQLALPVRAAKPDRKVPLVLQDQSDHPAPRATPARPRPSVSLPERTRLAARTTSFWCHWCARLGPATGRSAPRPARQ
jgi:hypothetical protein